MLFRSTDRNARLAPFDLKTSEELRLRRLSRDALYKAEQRQLLLNVPRGIDPTVWLVGFLRELVPTTQG